MSIATGSMAQVKWEEFDRLMNDASYKSAYEWAEKVYERDKDGAEVLRAAFCMSQAAMHYQEDAYDSAESRYRQLLPRLKAVDRALCCAFLGDYASALEDEQLLRETNVEAVAWCARGGQELNMTPTLYDLLVVQWQGSGQLSPRQSVEWQRRLVKHHQKDSEALRIWHDCRLLELLEQVPNEPLAWDTIVSYVRKYQGSRCGLYTDLYAKAAQYCSSKEEYVKAVAYCDTAIALDANSRGGIECSNLRADITAKHISVETQTLTIQPSVSSLHMVRHRNVSRLWYRVIGHTGEGMYSDKEKAAMLRSKAVVEGEWQVEDNGDYQYGKSYVALPPLADGEYILLVAPNADFKSDGFMAYELHCTDMLLVKHSGTAGLLLSRGTGNPIVGQEIRLVKLNYRSGNHESIVSKCTSDADGCYSFSIPEKEGYSNYQIVVERNGYKLTQDAYREYRTTNTNNIEAVVRVDRPIYRPGETVNAAVICYQTDGVEAAAMPAMSLIVTLVDPNGKEVETRQVATDERGIATAEYVLPTDRLPGAYTLIVRALDTDRIFESTSLRVEEYKQPKFTVTLDNQTGTAPAFGKKYTVGGLAASYSDVPVGGARVKYSVRRSQLMRHWWSAWRQRNETEVAQGETLTATDGNFSISFTPQPDSAVDLLSHPIFEYNIHVEVTDLNGETHEADTRLRVGFRNAFLMLAGSEDVATLDHLQPRLLDINDNPLTAEISIQIEKLQQPILPLLSAPAMSQDNTGCHTMTEQAFRKSFPNYAYAANYNDPSSWPVASDGWHGESGVYRITLAAEGADTATFYRIVTTPQATAPQSQSLLWVDNCATSVEVGATAHLRFGSRFRNLDVYYLMRVGQDERQFRHLHISNEIATIDIPVDSTFLGGFDVDIIAVQAGVTTSWRHHFDVPFSHKQLQVEVVTFRDKLQPGDEEQWTINVKNAVAATPNPSSAIILTMYDEALDSYGNTYDWAFHPWRTNINTTPFSVAQTYSAQRYWLNREQHSYFRGQQPSVWTLLDALPHYFRPYGMRMMKTMNAATAMVEEAVLDDAAASASMARGAYNGDMGAELEEAEEDIALPTAPAASEPPTVRSNLNTLAFFTANLHTDSLGNATYRFTLPDLLTRWHVRGLAVSNDIKIGTLDKSLIAQKPLMVQPNVPRFMRAGDTLSFLSKIVLTEPTDQPQHVAVEFLLTDAATGDTICHQTQHLLVSDHAQASFDIEVPHHLHVAVYRIVAQASGMSDGEQGQIPVVGNHQSVTLSQALYINGVGERTFPFPALPQSGTSELQLVAAEVVSDPIWLAAKVMPYVSDLENPSSLYIANQLYINTLGQTLIGQLGGIASAADLAGDGKSRLAINEDVKQTLLQSTPWVRAAESEEEQIAAVAHYFDSAALSMQHNRLIAQLADLQNADGGWCWMPEGKSNLWATQRVLQRLSALDIDDQRLCQRALDYIDREQQQYYERYIKPHLKRGFDCQPTNIDYLYVRSFYGKASTEAYRYYYNNALKHYKGCEHLYTQAQLALIFHRHGDHKAALDLLRRLKEKSLTSDEMGMYWRDNRGGWLWYQRPIETQAMLIRAFAEIAPTDSLSIGLMQQWLLKQKQATHWGNDAATTEAIAALMTGRPAPSTHTQTPVELTLLGTPLTSAPRGPEGYRSQRWTGSDLDSLLRQASHSGSNTVTVAKRTPGIAWGGVYLQYTDNLDQIPSSAMGIALQRTYLLHNSDGTSSPVDEAQLKVGDRITVRIDIQCDRDMDYLELVDGRPACVEPLSTQAGWRWNEGLNYYIVVGNTDTRCYIESLPKGKYWFTYDAFVTNPGHFLAGNVSIQCMYAPEFRATAPGQMLHIHTAD